ncbi:MAG TPA: DUF1501 domain-containing protein [Phycisphaerae bacterium]|nr:DUF1501 domain-containing protein [Phycisphaerae bacterium]
MSDTFHTRREFIGRGVALLSAASTVPLFLDRTAWAFGPLDRKGAVDDRVLVVLQLAGGNDGLNTIIPVRNDNYYKLRPRLAIDRSTALQLTSELSLHPAATGLKQLYDDGHLAIVQGVGYPNPDRSHFVATDIWSTADPQGRHHDGWIGRYFDCTCKGADRPDPKLAISITSEAPLALSGKRFAPVSFGSPDELTWRGAGGEPIQRAAFDQLNAGPQSNPPPGRVLTQSSALAYLERTAMDARASAREIQDAAGATGRAPRMDLRAIPGKGGRKGNGQLTQQLMMVKRMIAAGLGTRVYYVSLGGFDTHANQPNRHQQLMTELGEGLSDFVTELKNDGLLEKVLLVTFSEFGRRVAENASQGTDHGAAAPLFLVGGRVKPGLHGNHPGLDPADLDQGDLRWQTDFRAIYATVLKEWLHTDPARVLGAPFKPLSLLK